MEVPEFIEKKSDTEWIIPTTVKHGMRVPVKIIADRNIIMTMDEQVYEQATNVATLPGILNYSYCMPDGHISLRLA